MPLAGVRALCWKLRGAIKVVNQTLAELKVEKPLDKTLSGRIARRIFGYLITNGRYTTQVARSGMASSNANVPMIVSGCGP